MRALYARLSGNIEDGFIINGLSDTRSLHGIWVEVRVPEPDSPLAPLHDNEKGNTVAVIGDFEKGFKIYGLLRRDDALDSIPNVFLLQMDQRVLENYRRWL